MKLLRTNSVDFDVTDELLIRLSVIVSGKKLEYNETLCKI
jgi:hypothetical protein